MFITFNRSRESGSSSTYLGYYSLHEKEMEKAMAALQESTVDELRENLSAAQNACRSEVLWNSLSCWDRVVEDRGDGAATAAMAELLSCVEMREVLGLGDAAGDLVRSCFKCCTFSLGGERWEVAVGRRRMAALVAKGGEILLLLPEVENEFAVEEEGEALVRRLAEAVRTKMWQRGLEAMPLKGKGKKKKRRRY